MCIELNLIKKRILKEVYYSIKHKNKKKLYFKKFICKLENLFLDENFRKYHLKSKIYRISRVCQILFPNIE